MRPEPLVRAGRRAVGCLAEAVRAYRANGASIRAAAIAYYGLLSFFPFIVLLASVATLFIGEDPHAGALLLGPLRPFLPFLGTTFWERLQELIANRGVLSISSGVLLLYMGSRVMVATERALSAVFHAGYREKGTFARRLLLRLRAYVITALTVVVLGTVIVFRTVFEYVALFDAGGRFVTEALARPWVSGHVVPALVVGALAYAAYRRLPPVRVARQHALVGAAVFTVGHELAAWLYSTYVARVAVEDAANGSFVGVVSLTVWVFFLSSILLFGAEVVAALHRGRGVTASP